MVTVTGAVRNIATQEHCEIVIQVSADQFHVRGKSAAKLRDFVAVMTRQQVMPRKDRAIEHVESQRNSRGLKQIADHLEIMAAISTAVAKSAAGDHVIRLRQLRQREIGLTEISILAVSVSRLCLLDELGHVIHSDIGKSQVVLVKERFEIAVAAAGIEYGASAEVAQPEKHFKALALAFRAAPAERLNASRLELVNAVPVIMQNGGFFNQVHGRKCFVASSNGTLASEQ